MHRREMLRAGAAGVVVAGVAGAATLTGCATSGGTGKRPILLVHGAWHGGWCWQRVTPLLEAAGHKVYAPTLSGLAEKAGQLTRAINLDTHAQDVLDVIERNNLREVVLVGHSYAGMVIPLVADRAPQRLHRLVFLDALLLDNGQAFKDLVPAAAWQQRLKQVQEQGRGVGVPPFPAAAFGISDKADQDWVQKQLTLHPVGTYEQPMLLKNPFGNGLPKVYIECTAPQNPGTAGGRAKAKAQGWPYDSIATGHDAMVTAPGALAELLRKYA